MAEAKLRAAKIKAANTRRLEQDKVVSKDEVTLNAAAEAEAEAALMGAKAEVERAALTLSWTRVTAPFDGRVGRIRCAEGGLVTADRTQILRLVAAGPLRRDVRRARSHPSCNCAATALPSRASWMWRSGSPSTRSIPHAAKLDLIEPEVDPKTATVRFRATVPNPKGLLSPGMSARVRLTPAQIGKAIRPANRKAGSPECRRVTGVAR